MSCIFYVKKSNLASQLVPYSNLSINFDLKNPGEPGIILTQLQRHSHRAPRGPGLYVSQGSYRTLAADGAALDADAGQTWPAKSSSLAAHSLLASSSSRALSPPQGDCGELYQKVFQHLHYRNQFGTFRR